MKNIIKYLILTLGVASVSCTNLDEELYDVLSQDNFGSTESEMASLIGPAYGTLASYVDGYFWYGMCAGDDFIIPARGTDWYSGGIYLRAHTHDFNATDANTVYNFWKFSEVNTINKIIQMIETSTVEIAELMGAEISLHVDCQGNRIVIRTEPTFKGREGDTAILSFKNEKIHLFDKETEMAIAH